MENYQSAEAKDTFSWDLCDYEEYITGYKMYKQLKKKWDAIEKGGIPMPSSEYLAKFSDNDVYTMLYLYYNKEDSLETLERQFSIGREALLSLLEGRCRKECYDSFKAIEKMFQG